MSEVVIMKNRRFRSGLWVLAMLAVGGLPAGCGGGGGGGLSNKHPGDNDVNVVVCFGDSLTDGVMCSCLSYPTRLAGLIGKTVVNAGIHGTMAADNMGRVQAVIDQYHPGFMLILYGVGDIIHGFSAGSTAAAVGEMAAICKTNNVVPVIATYPVPIGDHQAFATGTILLNSRLRNLAADEDLECVELESEFDENPDLFVYDGLHPNETGTQIMAMAFADLF